MDWNGLLNLDDPQRNLLFNIGMGLLAGNQQGNASAGAMRGYQQAQDAWETKKRQQMMQEEMDMRKGEYDLRKSEYDRKLAEEQKRQQSIQRLLGGQGAYTSEQEVPVQSFQNAPIPAVEGAQAPNFGLQRESFTTMQKKPVFDQNQYTQDLIAAGMGDDLIKQQFSKRDPIKLGKNERLIDPTTNQEIIGAMPSAEDLPAAVQEYQYAQSQGYQGSFQDFQLAQKRAGASNVSVSVGTEKKYGEQFASELAKSDLAVRDAAIRAPELAERAIRIKSLVDSGKVITGTGADYRLEFAKAARLAGLTDGEDASNTEQLAADLANNVLDSIKASGMGGGTGFSNADRDFLERAKGGKINYEAGTLRRLAELSYRAAENSTKAWNKRSKEIPKTAIEGTGLDVSDVSIPQMPKAATNPTAPKPPKLGEVRNGYRFVGNPNNPQHYSDPTKWKKVAP